MTPTATEDTPPLALEEAARLTDFARACKAAARAVVLYPPGHPTIVTTIGRLVHLTSAEQLSKDLAITVLPDGLLLDGQPPPRRDPTLSELAAALHGHLIGRLTIHPGGSVEQWRRLLLLIGRPPDEVRREGGLAALWGTGASHIEISTIDYGQVLRSGEDGQRATWTDIIAGCLHGGGDGLNIAGRQALFEATHDPSTLGRLMSALDAQAVAAGHDEQARAAALASLLEDVVTTVTEHDPRQIDRALVAAADALSQVSPDLMAALLAQPPDCSDTPGLVDTVVSHMSDQTVARFVAQHALAGGTPMDRLAQAFHVLVPEDRRERVLTLARAEASSAAGLDQSGFEHLWDGITQKLLVSYSDKPFVSDQYGRELSRARTTAIDVERVGDDPPERMEAWLSTLSASELRRLDHALMLDLLRIEDDLERWATLMHPATALVNDELLIGDFEAASQIIDVLVRERAASTRRAAATRALEQLASGPLVNHVTEHLAALDEDQFGALGRWLVAIGGDLPRALADRLVGETSDRTRARLTALLVAFGPAGRAEIGRLRQSTSPAGRRAAILLLQRLSSHETLAELTGLLGDPDGLVLHDAVSAILDLRTERAHAVLSHALTHGSAAAREVILATARRRDERAAPVFAHLVRTIDHRGPFGEIYLSAIDALGVLGPLGDSAGIEPLAHALRRGEWWTPRRNATLRRAAAAALARIGSPHAVEMLERAAREGSRGVRTAARAAMRSAGAPGGGGGR